MKRLPVLVLLLTSWVSVAQTQFAPPGAEWYFGFVGGFSQTRGFTHFKYVSDTLIQGALCKALSQEVVYTTFTPPYIPTDTQYYANRYFYQSGDSVLYWDFDRFILLWRTEAVTGNTFVVERKADPFWWITAHIDSTKQITLNNIAIHTMWLRGTHSFGGGSTRIYGHIGPNDGFHYYVCWGFLDCFPPKICRYRDDQNPWIEFDNGTYCDAIVPSREPQNRIEIKIYPNPCTNFIQVEDENLNFSSNSRIEIFNITGQLVADQALSAVYPLRVDVRGFKPGWYFLKITDDRAIYSVGFIKQ